MFQDLVAAGEVVNDEPRMLERSQHVLGLERGKSAAQARSGTITRISSFTGALSEGMGR
jgi:hypothetical protein